MYGSDEYHRELLFEPLKLEPAEEEYAVAPHIERHLVTPASGAAWHSK